MENPADRKYTRDHEWVKLEGEGAVVGITDFAQSELGDLVFVELPEQGRSVNQKDSFCVVESTKAASDVYAPISGTVKEVNSKLSSAPELISKDPYGEGWLVKLEKISKEEYASLMDAGEYNKLVNAS